MKIAIQPDLLAVRGDAHQSFSARWAEQLELAGHEVCLVDVFGADFFRQIEGCDGFLWWFPPIPFPRDMAKRLMAALTHADTLPVFPDWRDCWHFDDKAAQSYLFQAAKIPAPRTWVFWQRQDAEAFCAAAEYPLVIKLSAGVYSQNVRLLRTPAEAQYWIEQIFSHGVIALDRPAGSLVRRALRRGRAALRMLVRGHGPSIGGVDFQKDQFLVQEFIPDNDYDTRIFVIGNRAFGTRRYNLPGDFRASGSDTIDRDPALMDLNAVRLAFRTAHVLRAQTICMDILRRGEENIICEVSYYFQGWSIFASLGHWTLDGDPDTGLLTWVEGHTRAEDAILEDFLARIAAQSPQALQPASSLFGHSVF